MTAAFDDEAERCIIGAVFLRNEAIRKARLSPDQFFNPRNRLIWSAMLSLHSKRQAIDPLLMERELGPEGAAAVGLVYMSECIGIVPTAENIGHYVAIVAEHALTREVQLAASRVLQSPATGKALLQQLMGDARNLLAGEAGGSVGQRVGMEADRRRASMAQAGLVWQVDYLDDHLCGIMPHDLVLLGAYTAAGKTHLASFVAERNAAIGRRVHLFALEAEPLEIERRIKFRRLSSLFWARQPMLARRMRPRYVEWYKGNFDVELGPYEAEVEASMRTECAQLYTHYRGRSFDANDLERRFEEVRDHSDLIILDHLHYVDSDDPNENRGYKEIVKRIRDSSLSIGKPVLVVVHLRKKDRQAPQVVPMVDDIHGASDISKISTRAIMLGPMSTKAYTDAFGVAPPPWTSPTLFYVAKDRMSGNSRIAAALLFDHRTQSYESTYRMGMITDRGDKFRALELHELPAWAHHEARCVTPPPPTSREPGEDG